MADLQPYRFEPECVPKCEDSESENKVVNNPLQGTFWCSCEQCQIKSVVILEFTFVNIILICTLDNGITKLLIRWEIIALVFTCVNKMK